MSFALGKQASGPHGFCIRTTHAFHDDLRSQCTCKAKVLQNPHDFNDSGGRRGSFLESFSLHFCFQLRFEILQDFKRDPCVLKNHWFSCVKTMIAPLHVSSTSTFRSSTVPHPSSTPLCTIYTPTTKLEMLIKPMKNKEKRKTPKVSDTMLTSSNKVNTETCFNNEATKECTFDPNPCATKGSFFENVLPTRARSTL